MPYPSRFKPRQVAAPRQNVISAQAYSCPELAPFTGRAGCLDAFAKPSLIGGKCVVPKHHAVANQAISKAPLA